MTAFFSGTCRGHFSLQNLVSSVASINIDFWSIQWQACWLISLVFSAFFSYLWYYVPLAPSVIIYLQCWLISSHYSISKNSWCLVYVSLCGFLFPLHQATFLIHVLRFAIGLLFLLKVLIINNILKIYILMILVSETWFLVISCGQIIGLYERQKLHALPCVMHILNHSVSCDSRLCLTIARSDL